MTDQNKPEKRYDFSVLDLFGSRSWGDYLQSIVDSLRDYENRMQNRSK